MWNRAHCNAHRSGRLKSPDRATSHAIRTCTALARRETAFPVGILGCPLCTQGHPWHRSVSDSHGQAMHNKMRWHMLNKVCQCACHDGYYPCYVSADASTDAVRRTLNIWVLCIPGLVVLASQQSRSMVRSMWSLTTRNGAGCFLT